LLVTASFRSVIAMLFNDWRAEAARIATGMYDIDLDRVPKEYLWRLFGDDVSPWEVAELCQNVIAAQEDQPDTTDISRGVTVGISGRQRGCLRGVDTHRYPEASA
jgi:hypothetical protein